MSDLRRRGLSVTGAAVAAGVLGATAPVWAPATAAFDALRRRPGFGTTRTASVLTGWAALETIGVGAAGLLWATGRADDENAHYRLQRWWADRLVDVLRVGGGLRIEVDGDESLRPGGFVMAIRHTSIADALLPVWLLGRAGLRPRYVLKQELAIDPCLDIVGHRLPNHFVDREPDDGDVELDALRALTASLGRDDAAVIYPEGMVVTDERRARAVERAASRRPERAAAVRALRRLAPVRPGGTWALLEGAPDADLVVVDHTGFEPLASAAGAPRALPLPEPVRVTVRRHARRDLPTTFTDFVAWFDEVWLALDRADPTTAVERRQPTSSNAPLSHATPEGTATPR